MPTIADIEELYSCCEGLRLGLEQFTDPLFARAWQAIDAFRWAVQGAELNEGWERLLAGLRRYRFFAGSTPLPFDHPALLGPLHLDEAKQLVAIGRMTNPRIAAPASEAIERLQELVGTGGTSPLLAPVLQLVQDDTVALALNDRQLVRAVKEELAPVLPMTTVVPAMVLSRPIRFNRVVLVGDVRNYPEFVFSAPRATEVAVVAYEWQRVIWQPDVSLAGRVAGNPVVLVSEPVPVPKPALPVGEPDPLFEVEVFERAMQREASRAPAGEYDLEEGRLHRLAGGQGVYLPSGERTTLVVDPTLPAKKRLRHVKDQDLEVGMFVVLRTGRSGNAVVQVADELLGKQSALLRAGQHRWKSALRSKLAVLGIDGVSRRLLAAGVAAATHQNIRNWASEAVIAPGRPSDFAEVLKLCGLDPDTASLWAGVERIRRARSRAGFLIRDALEEKLEQVDAEALTEDGEEVFELEEFPQIRLGAYQIVWRSPTTTRVHEAEIERVLDLGGE